ncbi:phenylalanine--tRNA ligase beta subunit-related protein [Piscinibacter sakaiensis]|uniref:B3/B4 tRNA-binding domain-containing protein n=1 Tax=Piscinibacter sakaiensis TaxID=1547922 RepID=A0A0K8P080_PISS1|nr:phenylalanine--tRNA ligase beta subunit-related protein [Piscinibacter sakaiensis]GAP35944.1 hypothetical protein ISF6_1784 [Piscinibacter sakaiensis]
MFSYAPSIRRDFPELATCVLRVDGVTTAATAAEPVARFLALARRRMAGTTEGGLPEIQAWRRAFAKMGLKPTQYRCASEALLRRLRKEDGLPSVHPLVDLCNAVSAGFAIPIAAIDLDRVDGRLRVQAASGTEIYETFAGDIEHPEAGEIIFVDAAHRAHARRWANRQSGHSAVMDRTTRALVVAEALHDGATADLVRLMAALRTSISALWPHATLTDVPVP